MITIFLYRIDLIESTFLLYVIQINNICYYIQLSFIQDDYVDSCHFYFQFTIVICTTYYKRMDIWIMCTMCIASKIEEAITNIEYYTLFNNQFNIEIEIHFYLFGPNFLNFNFIKLKTSFVLIKPQTYGWKILCYLGKLLY